MRKLVDLILKLKASFKINMLSSTKPGLYSINGNTTT
jgi:hypothetical protein